MNARFRSRPDTYCCPAARQYLMPMYLEGAWRWVIRLRYWAPEHKQPAMKFCPWCGKQLPEEGHLRVEEVKHESGSG